ncbi:MAG: RNA polymerase sigma factor [Candidatus Kapabacteria bacterium]|nr:RNA polymerase sigma factor [Candidatus Kapabacteria bacterium]
MLDESNIVDRLKNEDKSAFEVIVSNYSYKVLNTCYKFLQNREDAEDIAQEVFIEVFQSIRTFRSESKISTWIYRIAVTKCLDEIKKRNRKKRLSDLGKLLHIDEIINLISSDSPSDQKIKEEEKMAEINQALNKLPDNQRIAFTLSKIDGYSNSEIADIMNISMIAVESLIYRSKKKLNDELKNILKNNF